MSFQQDSAASISSVDVATGEFMYRTTASCCSRTSATKRGSSTTVFVFTRCACCSATLHRPRANSSRRSKTLTSLRSVSRVYTNLAVLDVVQGLGFVVRDIVPGMSLEELQAKSGAKLHTRS